MLQLWRIIFTVVGLGLAVYLILSQDFKVMPFIFVALVGLTLILGINALKAQRKKMAIFSFMIAAFHLFVAIFTFYVFHIYIA